MDVLVEGRVRVTHKRHITAAPKDELHVSVQSSGRMTVESKPFRRADVCGARFTKQESSPMTCFKLLCAEGFRTPFTLTTPLLLSNASSEAKRTPSTPFSNIVGLSSFLVECGSRQRSREATEDQRKKQSSTNAMKKGKQKQTQRAQMVLAEHIHTLTNSLLFPSKTQLTRPH